MLQPSRELMDDDSYKLAMELMIEDARQIGSGDDGKGKRREGSVSDNELAFRLYTQDLESAFTIDADRRLSASMQHAVRTDSNAFLRFQHEERMAQYDHEVAVALSDNRAPPPMPPPAPPLEPVPELEMEPASNNDNDDDDDDNGHVSPEGKGPKDGKQSEKGKGKGKESVAGGIDRTNSLKRARSEGLASPDEADDDLIFQGKRSKQGESSAWAASRQPEPNRRPCTSCMEAIPESQLIRAPCSHDYCHACVKGLFTSAMRDESLFPPKCCRQAIPAGEHVDILGADLINLYHAKRIEFSTENRTYCHNAECGAFINPAEVGRCSKCDRQTCVSCKKAAHIGDCPQDMELQRVLELAEQRNWRRCASCSSMVELAHGCNHMTCRCGAEFCYICGVKWAEPQTCPCPLFTEENLIEEDERIRRREAELLEYIAAPLIVFPHPWQPRPRAVPPRRAARQPRAHRQPRQDQECNHGDGELWRRLRGQQRCDVCTEELPHYVYECAECDLVICRTCRFNRL